MKISPGSLPANGNFWMASITRPITIRTAPMRISILAISFMSLFREEIEYPAEDRAHVLARNDHVDHAVFEEELRALEPRRKLLLDCLFDNPGAGETDEALRFRDDNVAEHREACSHSAEGRVCQNGDERQSCLSQPCHGGRRLGHLHEREDPLLHAGPARRGDGHKGHPFGDGPFDGPRDLFTDHGTHAAAHEVEIHDYDRHVLAAYLGLAGNDRVLEPRFFAAGLQLVLVVLEGKKILGRQAVLHLEEASLVHEIGQPLRGRNTEVVVALGAYLEVLLHLFAVDDLLAIVALYPEPFGDLDLLLRCFLGRCCRPFFFKPSHDAPN